MKKKNPKKKKWVACEVEADYFNDDRKIARKERKIASKKDRSKYKKTDQDKLEKQKEEIDRSNLLRGRVLSIISQAINVEFEGKIIKCVLRGSLKKETIRLKNLVTVGDFVYFEMTSADEGVIEDIEERRSILSRADHLHQRREQLIAANIDQVLITLSVVNPPLKPFIIDRYIIAARKGNMNPVIVVNKIDLLESDPVELEIYKELVEAWEPSKVPLIPVSASTGEGIDELKQMMGNRASVFSGQSGVGKSSLINALTKHDLEVGDVVSKTRKGAHTTTQAQLLPLDFGGFVIDTPGIKSFGIWNVEKEEVEEYFPEIHALGSGCKFPDCSHTHESECAVIDAVEKGELSELRYESYCYLIESVDEEHRPR